MMANRGWDGLGLEEGSEMVCLGPVYLETVAGVGRYQGLKLAGHGAFEEEEEENLGLSAFTNNEQLKRLFSPFGDVADDPKDSVLSLTSQILRHKSFDGHEWQDG
ncbi:unnamed protein product [Prunus armeniaca]